MIVQAHSDPTFVTDVRRHEEPLFAKILPDTRKVGSPQVCFSSVSGIARQMARSLSVGVSAIVSALSCRSTRFAFQGSRRVGLEPFVRKTRITNRGYDPEKRQVNVPDLLASIDPARGEGKTPQFRPLLDSAEPS
jgi:hypothetical protein